MKQTLNIDCNRTVAELALTLPGAARTFERLGIDYCCRGKQALTSAVTEAKIALATVVAALQDASTVSPPRTFSEPVSLIHHIVDTHHEFTRTELERLVPLAQKVNRVHGARHPELTRVLELVEVLRNDLIPHMMKEERVLFPFIQARARGEAVTPCFGSVEHPIAAMLHEHESVGTLLSELAEVTNNYTPPNDACGSYGALYLGLRDLQSDLHQHVHLENNVLFPMAQKLGSSS